MNIDDEALLDVIEQKKALYDKTSPKFSNRKVVNALWQECADELGVEVRPLKKRWSFLRDYFCMQHKIVEKKRQGLPTKRKKKWPLYERMQFLIPHLLVSQENYVIESDVKMEDNHQAVMYYQDARYYDNSDQFNLTESPDKRIINADLQPPSPTNCHKSSTDAPVATVGGSPAKSAVLDDDILFLKSLLPMMKKLDPITRLEFRIEAQALLLRYKKQSAAMESPRTITISNIHDAPYVPYHGQQ